VTGTTDNWVPTCTSDPPLPNIDCLSLLLGQPVDLKTAELRALGAPQQAELGLVQSVFGQLLGSAMLEKSGVGNVVQKYSGFDTVQITPQFTNELAFQNLSATARVTVSQRISDSVYVTYSRALNASQYEVVLVEYIQSDRISWILSRNEDRTFAIDFRIRYRF
jgi:autotransporter translocation and assembly factor TamB